MVNQFTKIILDDILSYEMSIIPRLNQIINSVFVIFKCQFVTFGTKTNLLEFKQFTI